MAIHPAEENLIQQQGERKLAGTILYLMCDDVQESVAALKVKGVECSPFVEARWGIQTTILLPGGSEIGLYQPRHELAINPSAT